MDAKKIRLTRNILIVAIILISIGVVAIESLNYFLPSGNGEEVLSFYHQWTSAGEQAALNAMINVFLDKYPDITVLPTPILSRSTSGGGIVLFNVVKPLVFSRQAPDSFEAHAGYESKTYFDAGLLESVDSIWKSEDLEKVTPKIVQAMCKFEGHYYSVPVDIHRSNVIWYNKDLLDKNGIDPLNLTTWDSFFAACDKLRANGVKYPIQMGTTWTAGFAFDQIIASQGIGFYQDWLNGKVISADDPRLLKSFEIFKKYISYVNPDSADIQWDIATKRIIDGEGAFNAMGDWANGEFIAANMTYDKDYGTFNVPETGNMYGLVIDTFQLPKNIKHSDNAEKWLGVVGSKEGQDAFNPLKGSISARIDTNVTKYNLYQRVAVFDFLSSPYMFPAVSNGAPSDFGVVEQNALAIFAQDLNASKAAKSITDYTKSISSEYTIEWALS